MTPGSEHSYRVTGHYGGQWDNTEWMQSLAAAEQVYEDLKQGNWLQLSIERTDGAKKASPSQTSGTKTRRTHQMIPVFGEVFETLREATSTELLSGMLVLSWIFIPMYYRDRIRRIRRRKEFYRKWAKEDSEQ